MRHRICAVCMIGMLVVTFGLIEVRAAEQTSLILRYPDEFIVDVTQAPYHADPTGLTDSTAALQAAIHDARFDGPNHGLTVYLPVGTYLISDELTTYVDGDSLEGHFSSNPTDARHIRIVGEHREQTVIRLQDGLDAFGNAEAPKPVLSYYRSNPGRGCNVAFENQLRNLTIDLGAGNPGAIGVDFHTNNGGGIDHVSIVAQGSSGYAGIRCHTPLGGIGMFYQVAVDGCDYGAVFAHRHVGFALQSVHFSSQRVANLWVSDKPLWIFDSTFTSDGTFLEVQYEANAGASLSQIVVSNCQVHGSAPYAIEWIDNLSLYIRASQFSGFSHLLAHGGVDVDTSAAAAEYVVGQKLSLFEGASALSFTIPQPDVDLMEHSNPTHITRVASLADVPDYSLIDEGEEPWVVIDPLDPATPGQIDDDGPLLQACIDAGAHTIALADFVDLKTSVTIRGATRRLFGVRKGGVNNGPIIPRWPLRTDPSKSVIIIEDGDGDSVRLEGAGIDGFNDKAVTFIESRTHRDVFLIDMDVGNMQMYKDTVAAADGRLFCVAINGGPLYAGGSSSRAWLDVSHQRAYAWIPDSEIVNGATVQHTVPFIRVSGSGVLSLRGAKLGEKVGPFVGAYDGGRLEILGGVFNAAKPPLFTPAPDTAAVILEDAPARIIAAENYRTNPIYSYTHPISVRETVNGETRELTRAATPNREGSINGGFILLLYQSGVSSVEPLAGDVDHNGTVEPTDALLSLQVVAGLTPATTIYGDADMSGNGRLDLTEVIAILRREAGLE